MHPVPAERWWSRNWRWLVPVGCLVLLGVLGAVFLAVFSIVMTGIKSSPVYRQAVEQATTNSTLVAQLGSPIRPGRLVSGAMSSHRSMGQAGQTTGSAMLRVQLRGPKGKATLYVEAQRDGDVWTFTRLDALIKDTDEKIDLLTQVD